jgi:hypothetical protein
LKLDKLLGDAWLPEAWINLPDEETWFIDGNDLDAVPVLAELLKSSDVETRWLAIEGLERKRRTDLTPAIPALLIAAQDENELMRMLSRMLLARAKASEGH